MRAQLAWAATGHSDTSSKLTILIFRYKSCFLSARLCLFARSSLVVPSYQFSTVSPMFSIGFRARRTRLASELADGRVFGYCFPLADVRGSSLPWLRVKLCSNGMLGRWTIMKGHCSCEGFKWSTRAWLIDRWTSG